MSTSAKLRKKAEILLLEAEAAMKEAAFVEAQDKVTWAKHMKSFSRRFDSWAFGEKFAESMDADDVARGLLPPKPDAPDEGES